MKPAYGEFSGDGGEYIISERRTPRHWYNYMWNDQYVGFLSRVGLGEGVAQDDMGRRAYLVTNRYIYLKETGKNDF